MGGNGGIRVDFMHPSYTGSGGWNHVITFSGYDRYNLYQLGGHYDGSTGTNLWVRAEANHNNTWTGWRRLLNTSSDPYAANMNQYVRTSDNVQFNNVTVSGGAGVVLTIAGGGDLQINAQVSGSNSILYNDYGTLNCTTSFTSAGDITAYSDIRLKDNIKTIENPLDKVSKIRGVTFTRNDNDDTAKVHSGVIAQEVLDVLPEVVNKEGNGYYSVAYGNMVGLLIESIKEQQKQIEILTQKITELENK